MTARAASLDATPRSRSQPTGDSQVNHPIHFVLRGERARLVAATVLISLSSVLELVPHLVVGVAAVAVFSPTLDTSYLYALAGAALGGVVLRFVLLGAGYVLSHAAAFRIMRKLRLALTKKLTRVPGGYYSEHPSGDLKKTLVDDVAALEGVFAHNLPELCSGLFVPVVAGGVLFAADWRLGVLSIALLPVGLAVQSFTMRGFTHEFERWHAAEAQANEGIVEFIRGVVVLKAFSRDVSNLARVKNAIYGIRDLATEMTRRTMAGYTLFFVLLASNLVVVLPAGAALVVATEITVEQFVLLVALGSGMLAPLVKLLFLFGSIQRVRGAWSRISALLMERELTSGARPTREVKHPDVRFNAVSFSYAGRSARTVERVSLHLAPGTVTAIVGPSGAGKTTLLKLLLRDYDVDEGSITVGGSDVRNLTEEARRELIAHVSQDTTLFAGSVRDNLLLARPGAAQAELEAAARTAQIHDVIESLPDGYDTTLGDRGSHLSGGERQRIAIARALLKNAPIVVLDEVTANVDPESERGIQEGLSALATDRVLVVVAHRLKTISEVEQIAVLDRGRLVDCARHEVLLERCEVYQRLWKAQRVAEGWSIVGAGS